MDLCWQCRERACDPGCDVQEACTWDLGYVGKRA